MENEQKPLAPIMTYFSGLQDPRIERNKLYPLEEVIVITILATIATGKTSKSMLGQKKPGCGSFSRWSMGYRPMTFTAGC